MHIPTELFLIFMRNSGITTGDRAGSFSEVQTFACSSCGICIDACQMNSSLGITSMQSAYLLKGIRRDEDVSGMAHNCLMCGRCDAKCPVGIELIPIRMIQRRGGAENEIRNTFKGYFRKKTNSSVTRKEIPAVYDFLPAIKAAKADVVFFAGCMTHLTPSVKNAMVKILDTSGVKYTFLDEDGGVCCGRPLMLAGLDNKAREVIGFNSRLIAATGAHTLVTSCPICYKVFRESYHLDVEVLHHTQFIKRLIDSGHVKMNFTRKSVVYHSPCDLGRGSGVYDEPLEVLKHVVVVEKNRFDNENSLCCGGSLGNMKLTAQQKSKIAGDAALELTRSNPDILATACPLCKKTFAPATLTRVADIAEIIAGALVVEPGVKQFTVKNSSLRQRADIQVYT
jgi:Fe-S oxidoreductase